MGCASGFQVPVRALSPLLREGLQPPAPQLTSFLLGSVSDPRIDVPG